MFDYARDPKNTPTPADTYLAFRNERPFWSPVSGGFWVLTNAQAMRDAFQDPASFSNRNIGLGYSGYPDLLIPEQLDPPDHRKYRGLLAPWFTPGVAKRLADEIRPLCADLIDGMVAAGQGDVIDLFVGRFPQAVFLTKVLHLPLDDLDTFMRWEHAMLRHPQVPADAVAAGQELRAYLGRAIEERVVDPIDGDLLSGLVHGEVDGRPVTRDEVLNIGFLLFLAGLDTVTTALSFALLFLAQNPEHRRQLVENPALVPGAVEELLRYHSFVNAVRTATHDFEFHGIPLREGDRVLSSATLAGRDPAEFPDPDTVDFGRISNRHMAFGAGPHRCLGSHLARIEMVIAIEEFHKRIPDYELLPGAEITYHAAGVMGPDVVPLRWRTDH
ncbi:cytochrome P450 [Pseudonocardia sp. GCM10023141]